jgi:hypothetical protein
MYWHTCLSDRFFAHFYFNLKLFLFNYHSNIWYFKIFILELNLHVFVFQVQTIYSGLTDVKLWQISYVYIAKPV